MDTCVCCLSSEGLPHLSIAGEPLRKFLNTYKFCLIYQNVIFSYNKLLFIKVAIVDVYGRSFLAIAVIVLLYI